MELEKIKEFENKVLNKVKEERKDILNNIQFSGKLDEETEDNLKN